MTCELVKDVDLSGGAASVYNVYIDEWRKTLFERFLEDCSNSFESEINEILDRLEVIGHDTGAREQFFKTKEGNPADGVCALYDENGRRLRLYCIRFGSVLLILGGGGSKKVQKLQQDQKLKNENFILRELSRLISERIEEREILLANEGMELEGDLKFKLEGNYE